MQNCERYRELCSASIDNELSAEEKRELSEHLSVCPDCAAYMADLREMRNAWDDFKEPLAEDMHEYIMKAVVKETQKTVKTKRTFPMFTTIAAAAACIMLALSGTFGDIMNIISNEKPDEKPAMEDIGKQSREITGSAENEFPQVQSRIAPMPSSEENKPQTASFFEESENYQNAAEKQAVDMPSEIQTTSFAFCMVAVGSGEVPAIENSEFIEKNGNAYYFKVTGIISDFDKTTAELKEKGFETAMREDLGVKTDTNALNGLLILIINP